MSKQFQKKISYRKHEDFIIAANANPLISVIFQYGAADIFEMIIKGDNIRDIKQNLISEFPDFYEDIENDIFEVQQFFSCIDSPYNEAKNEYADIISITDFVRSKKKVVSATIELTTKCNLRCKHCYHESYTFKGVTLRKLKNILEDLKDNGILFICFTGGEPFLRKDIIDILEYADFLGFIIEIKTNATQINSSHILRMSNMKISDIQVTIYDTETKKKSWFAGAFYDYEKVIDNINCMKSNSLPVSISFQAHNRNKDHIYEIYCDLLKKTGIPPSISYYITPSVGYSFEQQECILKYQDLINYVLPVIEKVGQKEDLIEYRKNNQKIICYAGYDQIFIDSNMTVYPCTELRIPLGNLKNENLEDILNRRFEKLDEIMPSSLPVCDRCDIKSYCDCCIGVAMLANGDFCNPYTHKCDVMHMLALGKGAKRRN